MELYVLRLDMYHEWALECGACDLLGVFDSKKQAVEELRKCLNAEIKDGRRVDFDEEELNAFENNDETCIYIDIYEDDYDFENGKDMANLVIEKKILNERGAIYND